MRNRLLRVLAITMLLAGTAATVSTASPIPKTGPNVIRGPLDQMAILGASKPDAFTLVVGTVLSRPNVVLGADHRRHLAYELQLLNVAPFPVRLDRIDTLDAKTGDVLATRRGAALTAVVERPEGGPFNGEMGGGLSAYAVLDVSLANTGRLPHALRHRLWISYSDPRIPNPSPYTTGATRVSQQRPIVIGRPLRGPAWVAVNGCCEALSGHRGAIIPVNGRLQVAERFAIDFVQLDQQRRLYTGTGTKLSDYAYFGDDVLSVAGGRVVRTHDGEPEQTPPNTPDEVTPLNAGGNWLVVDIGGGRFAFYAHLQPHSLTVKVGDRVQRGQVLGLLGNTGNSTAPHLHFHLMDGPSPLASNGLPYEFTRFTSPGTVTDENAMFLGRPTPIGPRLAGRHQRQLPLNLQVVDFG